MAKESKSKDKEEENIAGLNELNMEAKLYSRRGIKRLKYRGDDSGATEDYLEGEEEEGCSLGRQEEEPEKFERCRRMSPAPKLANISPTKTRTSPKTSPKSPKPTSTGGKEKAPKNSK